MPTVIDQIADWAASLKYWEQVALEKVICSGELTPGDLDELRTLVLEEAGIEPKSSRAPRRFEAERAASTAGGPDLRLQRMFNVKNVGALVDDQELRFETELTLVYGANGSGKSSYARMLACAAFARGDRSLLSNVFCPPADGAGPQADFELSDGKTSWIVQFRDNERCPDLATFYVFDTTSVQVHLTKPNTITFIPFGLSYLTALASVTDRVRELLREEISDKSKPLAVVSMMNGSTAVTAILASLGRKTPIAELKRLAHVTDAERQRLEQLRISIAQIRANDPAAEAKAIETAVSDLARIKQRAQDTIAALDKAALTAAQTTIEDLLAKRLEAEKASIDQFKASMKGPVGSDRWEKFVRAMKALANVDEADAVYPREGDVCLLCQQQLGPDERSLIRALIEYIDSAAPNNLKQAEANRLSDVERLSKLVFDIVPNDSGEARTLASCCPGFLAAAAAFDAECRRRRDYILSVLNQNPASEVVVPSIAVEVLDRKSQELKTKLELLRKMDVEEQLRPLEQEALELEHRLQLAEHVDQIAGHIEGLQWASTVERALGTTAAITRKYNELFSELVTKQYIDAFERRMAMFGRPMAVGVQTKGDKGKTVRQIVLESQDSMIPHVERVLSEGEKRAVALADFLAEVEIDQNSSGIALDDPVTSLDVEWKEAIAYCLTKEATSRQVIVFTHDLHFLYLLHRAGEQLGVGTSSHWIKRGDDSDVPGFVYLNNSPATERDYRTAKIARDNYERAKKANAADQELLLKAGFGALRTSYEALILYELLNEVVTRFDERISFGRLKEIVWDEVIVKEVIAKCEHLSRYIEGHLHSDAYAQSKPEPKDLLTEIETFEAIRKRLKNLK